MENTGETQRLKEDVKVNKQVAKDENQSEAHPEDAVAAPRQESTALPRKQEAMEEMDMLTPTFSSFSTFSTEVPGSTGGLGSTGGRVSTGCRGSTEGLGSPGSVGSSSMQLTKSLVQAEAEGHAQEDAERHQAIEDENQNEAQASGSTCIMSLARTNGRPLPKQRCRRRSLADSEASDPLPWVTIGSDDSRSFPDLGPSDFCWVIRNNDRCDDRRSLADLDPSEPFPWISNPRSRLAELVI